MKKHAKPIHWIAQEALAPIKEAGRAKSVEIELLADPELAVWYAPYPEVFMDQLRLLSNQLLNLCPKGKLTFMLQASGVNKDTVRTDVQMNMEEEDLGSEADFSLAVLATDEISTDINLLGIDCPEPKEYVLGYAISVPLIKGEKKTGLLNQHANQIEQETQQNLSVLLVDDNEVNRLVVSKFLRRWGMQVDQAFDGLMAIDQFRMGKYDLVLMDLEMPNMDGYQASKAIRALEMGGQPQEDQVHTPIIALTAYTMVEAKEKAFASGMNDFVTKPLDPPQLYHKIINHTSNTGKVIA